MKKRLLLLLLMISLLIPLAACGESEGRTPLSIYRVVAPYYRTDGELLSPETVLALPGVRLMSTAISSFNAQPSDARLQSPLAYGAAVTGWEIRGKVLYLEVNRAYAEMSGLDLSLSNCCCVLTFGAMEGIDKVAVQYNDSLIFAPIAPKDVLTEDVTTGGN